MPGPTPNPHARRRNDRDAWRTLPPVCTKPAPAWPLKGRKPAGLVELWRHLWTLPVADLWHEQNGVRLVARYARLVLLFESALAGEDTGLAATVLAGLPGEIRQLEDRLLISPLTRLKARILVEDAPEVPAGNAEVRHLDDARAARLAAS